MMLIIIFIILLVSMHFIFIFTMPFLARPEDLSLLILVLFFLAINLHLRLQCLQHIPSELALETQAVIILVTLCRWVCIIFDLVFLLYVRGVRLTVLAIF